MSDGKRILNQIHDYRATNVIGFIAMTATIHQERSQGPEIRAPEVRFNVDWGSKVDIWGLGVMVRDIFEDRHLFDARDEDGGYSPSHHVAEMVAYLGLPPVSFVRRSKWLGAGGVTVPATSLQEVEENLTGENQQMFLEFMRSMLQWIPEKRKTAQELLDDAWLN
ncbi:uncharacterized protein BO95DRAFT_465906 [Aspergillus brunneoviolaceus CBS 621.78]|uniref:Uncharacterized protein n=1 Tax=Aspergillus brunneoviolaceus CBS 621.78 TaxID=1450534 RepID=A0ACD1G2S0_9EURO|nr:hypothetical protein BO95DRAFT_465906 [Aspergillus brunneoviolaceus CBS 621.78]RAH43521.1 hypothetical protein BO95DRAFT_465906 [Aspergillus brunneoviolaceus CBS 621.78]